jgi:plasmid stabilization system protein ParE
MGYKVIISPKARADLRAIVTFIARDNACAPLRFGEQLQSKAMQISDFPEMGRQLPESENPNVRDFPFKSYRIVYEVHDDQRMIAILRFWHAARGEPILK